MKYPLAIAAGCIACLIGCFSSFFVTWVHPNIRLSKGLYEIDYPLDIGLLQCYSSICKDDYDIRHVLHGWESRAGNTSRSLRFFAADNNNDDDDDDQQNEDSGGIHIPPINIKPPSIGKKPVIPSDLESRLLREFVHVFEVASLVSILFIALSFLCASGLLITVLWRCSNNCSHQSSDGLRTRTIIRKRDKMILFAALFLLFLSTIFYIRLTYYSLNGGHYVYGIWILTYAIMLGLICALISAIVSMDEDENHAASHRNYRNGYELVSGSNSHSYNDDDGDTECNAAAKSNNGSISRQRKKKLTISQNVDEGDQIELAPAPSHYQYQATNQQQV